MSPAKVSPTVEALRGELPPAVDGYRLTHVDRPWTLNVERQGNRFRRADLVKQWRADFATLARQARMQPCGSIAVTVRPELQDGRGIPDTGACVGAAKAGIDGIKDAGVIPDDSPVYVRRLTFEAPIITGRYALTLDVEVLS